MRRFVDPAVVLRYGWVLTVWTQEFSIEIPDKDADNIHSVDQAVEYILHAPDGMSPGSVAAVMRKLGLMFLPSPLNVPSAGKGSRGGRGVSGGNVYFVQEIARRHIKPAPCSSGALEIQFVS